MSIADFVTRLYGTELDLTAREIAEILWLWGKTVSLQELETPSKNPVQSSPASEVKTSSKPRQEPDSSAVIESLTAKADLYPKVIDRYLVPETTSQERGYPLQIPDAPAIPNQRQIRRSLESLRRKFPSPTELEFRQHETINRIVEQDIWTPIMKPRRTSIWLDLVLVIEVNNSLAIWQQTVAELRQILKRLGIFRHFETWGLQINLSKNQSFLEWLVRKLVVHTPPELLALLMLFYEKEGIQLFRYDDPEMRPYRPETIGNYGRETLILLVSDLVSPAWYSREIHTLLQQWSRRGMVNLLQPLPERLWSRTALGQQRPLKFSSSIRTAANQKLISRFSAKETIISQYKSQVSTQEERASSTQNLPEFKLPVTSLEPHRLETWSTLIMGMGNNQSVGYGVKRPRKSFPNPSCLSATSPQERVKRFQTIASPSALKLAELLSAVLVTLPVIRVIQYTMLPELNQSHVAEVLMGGLFEPLTETMTPHSEPDEIEFHFFPGLREELLSQLTVDEIASVIERVSAYVAEKMGISLRDFEARLMSPQDQTSQFYPFANVQAQVLQGLGGKYAEFAKALEMGSQEESFPYNVVTLLIAQTRTYSFEVATVERDAAQELIIHRTSQETQGIVEELAEGIELELVEIPAGKFVMGSPESEPESEDNEKPQHLVTIEHSFYMGRYPVTQKQWEIVAGWDAVEQALNPDPSRFKEDFEEAGDRWQRPVEQVSWEDAVEFCARLSQKTGWTYRLPSEAEWEYACRGVTLTEEKLTVETWNEEYSQPFHFGETILPELANYRATQVYNNGKKGEFREQTTPVGYFKAANPFGLYDLHGNVWEWCGDDWENNYNPPRTQEYYKSDRNNQTKVMRGGSWDFFPRNCRSAFRFFLYPVDRVYFNVGFRVVCERPKTL